MRRSPYCSPGQWRIVIGSDGRTDPIPDRIPPGAEKKAGLVAAGSSRVVVRSYKSGIPSYRARVVEPAAAECERRVDRHSTTSRVVSCSTCGKFRMDAWPPRWRPPVARQRWPTSAMSDTQDLVPTTRRRAQQRLSTPVRMTMGSRASPKREPCWRIHYFLQEAEGARGAIHRERVLVRRMAETGGAASGW